MPVYLICLDEPFGHAKHYIGYADELTARLRHHRAGTGANLLKHVARAGITWTVVRVWKTADRNYERRLKSHSGTRYCPRCRGEAAWTRGAWEPSAPYLHLVAGESDGADASRAPETTHSAVAGRPVGSGSS